MKKWGKKPIRPKGIFQQSVRRRQYGPGGQAGSVPPSLAGSFRKAAAALLPCADFASWLSCNVLFLRHACIRAFAPAFGAIIVPGTRGTTLLLVSAPANVT